MPKLQEIVAFKKKEDCPRLENQTKVQLDMKNNCVWVPLNKTMVPFDIRAVRNITFQHMGKISQLRINFNVPGKTGKHAVRFPEPADFASPPSYIQELIFKSANRDHYETLVSDFKRMQRDYNPDGLGSTRSKALQLESGKRAVLEGVYMKPSFSGKKCSCRLELHTNGFRIRTNKEETLDLLFEDIERLVYMPADENQVFVLHFHLKNSVLLGAKAVFDVQVNAQVGAVSTDLTDKAKKKRRMNEAEEDELFEKMWDQLEEFFESFIEAVSRKCKDKLKVETCDLDFPLAASFNFSSELLYFTETALVCLNCNLPFLFIPFDTVEVAAFERAGHVSKSVDLTIIFKDYSKPTVTIGGIASNLKQKLQQALDERDVIVLEGTTSLKWSVVLRRIAAELDDFVNKQGAWMYFAPKSVAGDASAEKRKAAEEQRKKARSSGDSDYEGGSDGEGEWDSDPSGSIDEGDDDDDDDEDDEDSEDSESFASEDEVDSEESYDDEDSSPPKRRR